MSKYTKLIHKVISPSGPPLGYSDIFCQEITDLLLAMSVRENPEVNDQILASLATISMKIKSDLECSSPRRYAHAKSILMTFIPIFTKVGDSKTISLFGEEFHARHHSLLTQDSLSKKIWDLFFPCEDLGVVVMRSGNCVKIIFQPTQLTRLWTVFSDLYPFGDVGALFSEISKEKIIKLLCSHQDCSIELLGASHGGAMLLQVLGQPGIARALNQINWKATAFNAPGTMHPSTINLADGLVTDIRQRGDAVSELGHQPDGVETVYYDLTSQCKSLLGQVGAHIQVGPVNNAIDSNGRHKDFNKYLHRFLYYFLRPLAFVFFAIFLILRSIIYWSIYQPILKLCQGLKPTEPKVTFQTYAAQCKPAEDIPKNSIVKSQQGSIFNRLFGCCIPGLGSGTQNSPV